MVDNSVVLAQRARESIASMRELARRATYFIKELNLKLQEQSSASKDVAVKIEQVSHQTEPTSQRMQQGVSRFQI